MEKIGLADRRLLKEFQENYYAGWLKDFNAAVKVKIPVEVNWDSMFHGVPENMSRESLVACWKNNFFEPVSIAFGSLTGDDMGKEAVKGAIKKITIEGADASNPSKSLLEGSTFKVKFSPTNGGNYAKDIGKAWQKYLETKI